MGPYIDCCSRSKYSQGLAPKKHGEDLRVSLWILNMLQKEREIENEAWLAIVRNNKYRVSCGSHR